MKKKVYSFLLLMSVIFVLAACGDKEVQPVAINEKTDTCATCNMAVVDDQYATQLILENGKSLVFDDIGCMYEWVDEHADQKVDAQFVRDYNNQEWVLVDKATYVYNQAIKTPMAYNVISFTEKAEAEKFAASNEGSTLLTASELGKHRWNTNQDMMMETKEEHGASKHSEME